MPSRTMTSRKLAAELGPRVARLVRVLIRETSGASRTQLSVLATLRDSGPRRVTDLAASEHVTQPSMTTLLSRLERQGLVERRADDADRRVVNTAITPAGLEVLAEQTDARAAALAGRLERLAPEDRAALAAALPALDRLIDDQ